MEQFCVTSLEPISGAQVGAGGAGQGAALLPWGHSSISTTTATPR